MRFNTISHHKTVACIASVAKVALRGCKWLAGRHNGSLGGISKEKGRLLLFTYPIELLRDAKIVILFDIRKQCTDIQMVGNTVSRIATGCVQDW